VAETPAGDSSSAAVNNNSIANAIDLSDRSRFGLVSDADAANVADRYATSVKLTATMAGTGIDSDYVKVYLRAGEKLVMDIDGGIDGGGAATSTNTQITLRDAAGVSLASNNTAAVTLGGGGSTSTGDPYLEYTASADGFYYVQVNNPTAGDVGDYELWLSIDNPVTGNMGFDYTILDNGINETTHVDVYRSLGSTIAGTAADEILLGGNNDDTLQANAGNDVLLGNGGADTLLGGDGADHLEGGADNDTLDGGAGNDILYGGAGNDLLTGGAGADVFAWTLADRGAAGSPAADTVFDFDTAAGSDRLDLRDLLVGEITSGVNANLDSYLHFEKSGADTVVHISSTGGFSGGYSAGAADQQITLAGVDLVTGFPDDNAIITDLLSKTKLITD
jgi:Ca2+-binding RTX toxin-like protein